MRHSKVKELFTGRRNVFTVTAVLIGGYFIAYPLVQMVTESIGYWYTIFLGFIIIVVGDYVLDVFHKKG